MELVKNKLRVRHFPQVGTCKDSFDVEVKDEYEAYKIAQVLAAQHLWLEANNIIPDYSNAIIVEMFDEEIDEETGKPYGWGNYYNEAEFAGWEDVEEYLSTAIN